MSCSYRANISSVSTMDGMGADTAVCEKKKTAETSCMWILIVIADGRQRAISLWEVMTMITLVNYVITKKGRSYDFAIGSTPRQGYP